MKKILGVKIYCNKCGKELYNGAGYCSFCGAKQELVKCEENDIVLTKNERKSINCPCCGSDNIQKYSLIYLNGLGKIDGSVVGVGNGGLYSGYVNGKSQSALSEITAPPKKMWVIRRFCLMGILMSLFTYFLSKTRVKYFDRLDILINIFFTWFVPIYYAVRGYIYNKRIYQRLYYLWDKKYLCLKCSQWFYLDREKEDLANEENKTNEIVEKWKNQGKALFFGTILAIILCYIVGYKLQL